MFTLIKLLSFRSVSFAAMGTMLLAMFARMGAALEVIAGAVTAPGATLTAWTVAAGNSLTIRSAPIDSQIALLQLWAFNQVAGVMRVRSPRLHDNVQGIRSRISAANVEPLLANTGDGGVLQKLTTQDVLTVEHSGSAVAGQIEGGALLVYYNNIPQISARLIDQATLLKSGVNLIGQEVSITTGVAIGFSGQVAINVTNDNFKANTDYALVGGMVDTRVGTIRIQGIDTGNLGLGFPGEPTQRHVTSNFFARLSMSTGLPCIPVFNSANKNAILIDAFGNQGAITAVVTLYMVELPAGTVPPAK
jgi:hypothetical protein